MFLYIEKRNNFSVFYDPRLFTHDPRLFTHDPRLFTHHPRLSTHHPRLFTHEFLPTTHDFLPTTFYPRPTTFYPPPTTVSQTHHTYTLITSTDTSNGTRHTFTYSTTWRQAGNFYATTQQRKIVLFNRNSKIFAKTMDGMYSTHTFYPDLFHKKCTPFPHFFYNTTTIIMHFF